VTPITDEQLAARGAAIVRAASRDVEPPLPLREWVEAERTRARPRIGRRRLVLPGALAGAAAALIVAVMLALGGGASDASLDDAAALGPRPATTSTPAVEHAGIVFPDWSLEFGWRSAGQRTDEIGGRSAKTAVYAKDGNQVAYTIVDGSPLDGTGGRDYVDDGRRVVTFERNGHTCVVSAPLAVNRDVLLKLAAWDRA
jgi:hypothetical protein